jgi:predicted permease
MRIIREWMWRLRETARPRRIDTDLEEELRQHVEFAAEAARRRDDATHDAVRAARLQAGGISQAMDAVRDQRGLPWLDSLASDVVFGWRQLKKHPSISAAAILSLALALGATTAAFRLVDAVLLRPLPIVEPGRLFTLETTSRSADGSPSYRVDFDYPSFRRYRKTVEDRAELMVVGVTDRVDAILGQAQEPEKIYRQFVSGNVFTVFGLRPAVGRLLTTMDDALPGAHPVAVLGHDLWRRRFDSDPNVAGKTLLVAGQRYDIVGVAPRSFFGTEPGSVTDVFIPAMMNTQALERPGWSWFRIWVRPHAGVAPEHVREPLQAIRTQERLESLKKWDSDTPKSAVDSFLSERVVLNSAESGASSLQKIYRRPLLILGVLVSLVLLVACANLGNLLAAQASARGREMALRVSIGAGHWRLIQMVLVESALMSLVASLAGALFAWWSAPWVVAMLAPPNDPVRLVMAPDWRTFGFSVGLTITVSILFGLAPALRVSAVTPTSVLKGGANPNARRRLMKSLVAAQMAFCVVILFVAALLVATFHRISTRPLGFSPRGVLLLDTQGGSAEQPPEVWAQVVDGLARSPGVESVAFARWPLLSRNTWTAGLRPPGGTVQTPAPYLLDVSSGFFETMRIEFLAGRDFRPGDMPPRLDDRDQPLPGVAIVNETFARTFFNGQNPVGRWVAARVAKDVEARLDIVGWVRDAAYRTVQEPIRPGAYVPIEARGHGTLIIRASTDPLALAPALRREVVRARSDFRVRNVDTQTAVVERQFIRERLLAALSGFFAIVALLLAAIGLYGVLNYSVLQQRREIGIRMALGARSGHVVFRITADILATLVGGLVIGLAAGMASVRFVEALLFEVKASDAAIVAVPIAAVALVSLLAALPPLARAVRIDPVETLRAQ